MKIRFILLIAILAVLEINARAQCPQKMAYQTLVKDAAGNILPDFSIVFRFTIMDSLNPGTPVYREQYNTSSNSLGQVILHPGTGVPSLGTFNAIDWATGHKYMQVEIQPYGTGPYINMGTEIQNSVPYALYADSAGKGGYPQHHIGENYGGGVIFYVTDNGQHGLIADSADLGADTITWARIDTTLLNASLQGTGGGYVNTERIVVNQGAGNYAANLCANDSTGGYGDWFLPSASELILLYQQQQVVGNFSSAMYWSSTESAKTTATALNFSTGITTVTAKASEGNVRAIRAF